MLKLDQGITGRVLLLHTSLPIDGGGVTPDEVATAAHDGGAKFVLLDWTHAPYINSDGLRWLMQLQDKLVSQGAYLRIASSPTSKICRTLALFPLEFELFGSIENAWKSPWPSPATVATR